MGYPGGKSGSGVYQQIINQMPKHSVYVEAFLGGGAILRLKRPAPLGSIGIDRDPAALAAFRADHGDSPCLQLCEADAIQWLAQADLPRDALVYLDPPYLLETRSSERKIYRFELERRDHEALLAVARGLGCRVMISGYWSGLYAEALAGWRSVTFRARTRGGRVATEWLWMNYAEPAELHDYRFLGGDFRERERIKRKQARWRERLAGLPAQERYALLSVLEELRA